MSCNLGLAPALRLITQVFGDRLAIPKVLRDDPRYRIDMQAGVAVRSGPDGTVRPEVAAILATAIIQFDLPAELVQPECVLQSPTQYLTPARGTVRPAAEVDPIYCVAGHKVIVAQAPPTDEG